MALTYLSEKLERGLGLVLLQQKSRFSALCSKLEALNPLGVLTRGYAAVFERGGDALSSVEQVNVGSQILVRMADGSFEATVTGKGE